MTRRRKPVEDWRGQIGMDVGEQRQRSELEGSVQKRVIETLEAYGVWVKRNNTGAIKMGSRFIRFGEKGDPDLECRLRGGTTFFVETKRAKGGKGLTSEQKATIAKLREWGFVAGPARSPEEAVALMREAQEAELRRRAA